MAGLHILDAHDPRALMARGFIAVPECLYAMTRVGQYAYVTGQTGLHAIKSVSRRNPASQEYNGLMAPVAHEMSCIWAITYFWLPKPQGCASSM